MKYLPYIPLALAIVLALTLGDTEDPAQRQLVTGWVALLIGASLALSGIKAVNSGEVLVRTRSASRERQPGTFWTTVVVFRFGIAAVFLAVGLWNLV